MIRFIIFKGFSKCLDTFFICNYGIVRSFVYLVWIVILGWNFYRGCYCFFLFFTGFVRLRIWVWDLGLFLCLSCFCGLCAYGRWYGCIIWFGHLAVKWLCCYEFFCLYFFCFSLPEAPASSSWIHSLRFISEFLCALNWVYDFYLLDLLG